MVRTERFKYVHFAGLPPVLFDLVDDPLERCERSRDPAAIALKLEGMERLLELRMTHEDDTLVR